MTITTTRAERSARSAFTLIELLVAMTLGSFLLAAILGTILYVAKSQVQLAQYVDMDTQIRRAVDRLGNDLKVATDIRWNSATDITLTIPDASNGSSQVTYAWTNSVQGLYRVPGNDSAATSGRQILIKNIPLQSDGSAGVSFARFNREGAAADTDLATKRIQISVTVQKLAARGLTKASSSASCSFILRNKVAS